MGTVVAEMQERKLLFGKLSDCKDFGSSFPFKLSTEQLKDARAITFLTDRYLAKIKQKGLEKALIKIGNAYVKDLFLDLNHLYEHVYADSEQTKDSIVVTLQRLRGISFDLQKSNDDLGQGENLYADHLFTVSPPLEIYGRKKLEKLGIHLTAKDKKRLYGVVRATVSWDDTGKTDEFVTYTHAAEVLRPFFELLGQTVLFVHMSDENQ